MMCTKREIMMRKNHGAKRINNYQTNMAFYFCLTQNANQENNNYLMIYNELSSKCYSDCRCENFRIVVFIYNQILN